MKSELDYEVVLIDATETPIERPKKEQIIISVQRIATTKKEVLFRKKEKTEFICTAFANGQRPDFRLFKESKTKINPDIKVITDTGYQGIQRLHSK